MINWKQKLSSRKFWAAVAGFISPILILFSVEDNAITTITGLISSCGTLIAYILVEGYIDGANAENTFYVGNDDE